MPEKLPPLKTGHEAHTNVPAEEQKITLILDELLSATYDEEKGEYAHISGIMQNVFKDLVKNPERERKYRDFLKNVFRMRRLWQIAGLPHNEERFESAVLIYAQQRLIDDIIDGDTPIKPLPEERVAYVEERIKNLASGNFDRADPVDSFSIRILADIKILDESYVEKAKERLATIMRSISFDGKRIVKKDDENTDPYKAFTIRAELEKHFFDLDIRGTIGLTLFLFGLEDSDKNMELAEPLGQAARICYNLKDFQEDVQAGLCNIPQEDAFRLHITQGDLDKVVEAGYSFSKYPENIRTWLHEQLQRGNSLLALHKRQPVDDLTLINQPKGLLKVALKARNALYVQAIKRAVLKLAYVDDAKNVFSEVEKKLAA